MKNFRYQRKTIIVVRKRIINLIIKNSTKREEKFTIFINLINFFFFFSNHYEWTTIPLWNSRVAEQPFRKCWDVLRYSTNKVYTKTTREWRNSRESWRRNGETIDISGNNEKRERERGGGVNAPEARTSQNPTGVSANPLFLGSLWFKLRGGVGGGGREEGRRMTGEVIWSKPRASGKGTSSSGKVKFLRHPRGRFIVSMRRHTMTQFKKK